MLEEKSFCRPKVSCVVEANIEDVWLVVRDWSQLAWVEQVDETPVEIFLVEGAATAVGSVRAVRMGPSIYFERLVGLDDETHTMKWRIVSHPDSVSPFTEASFLNFNCQLSLREVTQGDLTFVEFRGSFYTEHEHQEYMNGRLVNWFQTAFTGLKRYMAHRQGRRPPPEAAGIGQHSQFSRAAQPSEVPSSLRQAENPYSAAHNSTGNSGHSVPESVEDMGFTREVSAQQQRSSAASPKPMGQMAYNGRPPISTGEVQAAQLGIRQESPNMWTKLPSIGVGSSSQAADMQRWAQMSSQPRPAPQDGSQPQGHHPQWPPSQHQQWPYR